MVCTSGLAHTIAHIAQTGDTGHVLQFAVAIGAAGQTIQGMVGNIEFHHTFAQVLQLGCLGAHHHASLGGCGARSGETFAAINFHQTQAARTKRLEAVGGAKFGHLNPSFNSSTHERGALGHADVIAVDA